MEVLAVIPARGGSKGIPSKNIAPVAGRPLIEYSIMAAHASRSISRTVVSTDSEEIAAISAGLDAEVPFIRPAELASDETHGVDPILHAVEWLEREQGYVPDAVMMLQPTSPFRTAEDTDGAVSLMARMNADSVIAVTAAKHHPLWMRTLDEDCRLSRPDPEASIPLRRQELPPIYALNGAIYLVRREVLIETRSFYGEATYGYVMPDERSLDVDTPWDLQVADLVMRSIGGT